MLNKRHELLVMIEKNNPDVICITEVIPKKLRIKVQPSELKIDGFDCFSNIQNNIEDVRGTVLYVREQYKAQQLILPKKQAEVAETVWCEIPLIGSDKFLIGGIYRSPNSTAENNTALNELLIDITNKRTHVLLMGDFNLPEINWEELSAPGKENRATTFLNTIRDTFLFQHVRKPTHYRGDQQPTLIDLIFTNEEGMIKNLLHNSPLGKSHHHCLTFQLVTYTEKSKENHGSKYSYLRGDYENMRAYLSSQDLMKGLEGKKTQEAWDYLVGKVETAIDRYIPKVKGGKHVRRKPLWLNDKALTKVKKKREAYKRYMQTREGKDYLLYVKARNQVKSECRKSVKQHEKDIARAAKSNPKAFYAYAKNKLQTREGVADLKDSNNYCATTNTEKAEMLNNFFCQVFTKENLQTVPNLTSRCETNLEDIDISVIKVKKLLCELNTSKSAGSDGMHPKVLRELSEELAEPLAAIFRSSLQEGKLPHQWKSANVTPLFKKGSKNDPGNYRPVSLTSIPCKLMEKVVREAIFNHLESNDLLTEFQHGFVTSRSCVTNLLGVIDDWTRTLEDGDPVDAIYLDFSKAFDSVPHIRLLRKMDAYGIRGKMKNWISDFLIGRKQRVKISGSESSWKDVTSGVPQGSVLGPVLFVLFINDLPEVVENTCSMYADDTKIYAPIRNDGDVTALQMDLDNLVCWADTWQLRFNASKCKTLHLGKRNQEHSYSMRKHDDTNRVILESTSMEKDLGVLVDNELRFTKHIVAQVNKANKILGLIRRSYEYIDYTTMKQLFIALVRPHLEFAQTVWSPQYVQDQNLIERVLHRATKCVPGLNNLEYEDRLKKMKIPSMCYRRMRGDLIEVYKFMHHIYKCKNLFEIHESTTRGHKYKSKKYFCATNIRKHFFSNRVVNLWNSLDSATVEAPTLNSFKNRIDKRFQTFIYCDKIDYNECAASPVPPPAAATPQVIQL